MGTFLTVTTKPGIGGRQERRKVFEGVVDVCCHRVSFWYDVGNRAQTEELAERLTEEAESRAKTCISDGCSSGELNCLYDLEDGSDPEIRGWWEIKD